MRSRIWTRRCSCSARADKKHADDLAGLELAKAQLATHQGAVDSARRRGLHGRTDSGPAAL